jgi:hypothetical protein
MFEKWHGVKKMRHQKNKYSRHQFKKLRDQRKHIHFSCAGAMFWPFYAIIKSCGH